MKLLPLKTNLYHHEDAGLPFSVYTVGTEHQQAMTRIKGFSSKQLFITFSGAGTFRSLNQDEWDIISPFTLLYLPANYPHEYLPQGPDPWFVGYVSFSDFHNNLFDTWGFGDEPQQHRLNNISKLYEWIEQIWSHSGPQYDMWVATEGLFSFSLEVIKQISTSSNKPEPANLQKTNKFIRYHNQAVDNASRFLHDHLQRDFTLTELASHVGYSTKQINRLFQKSLGMTPLQYLQKIRLQAAALLLTEYPTMTVRQVADHIGMEPEYFTRLFKRQYGVVPSLYKSDPEKNL